MTHAFEMALTRSAPRCLASLVAAFTLLVFPAVIAAQDNGETIGVLTARARAIGASVQPEQRATAAPLWNRVAELNRARGDSGGEADALVESITALLAGSRSESTYLTSVLPMMRRAVTLFMAQGARNRAGDAIEAANFRNAGGAGVADSLVRYRRELLALRQALGDRPGEARIRVGISWSAQSHDSSLMHARLALSLATAARDTVAELYALNALGGAYSRLTNHPTDAGLRKRGRDSAVTYYRAGARLAESARNEYQERMDLSNLVSVYQSGVRDDSSLVDSAFSAARELLQAARRTENLRSEVNTLSRLGLMHREYRTADSASSYFAKASAVARARHDTLSLRYALHIQGRGELSELPDSALIRYRELESISNMVDPWSASQVWGMIADAYAALERPDSALRMFQRMEQVWTPAMQNQLRLGTIAGMAEQHLTLRNTDSSLYHFRRLTDLADVPALRSWAVRARIGRGRAYLARGTLDSAALIFEREVRASTGGERAMPLSWLADAEQFAERFDSSFVHRRAALAGFRATGNRGGEANQLNGLGSTFRQVGQMDSAVVYHRAALEVYQRARLGEDAMRARRAVGDAFLDADMADSALISYRRALPKVVRPRVTKSHASLYGSMGFAYMGIGQRDSARVYLERALSAFRSNGNQQGQAASLINLAYLHFKPTIDDSAVVLMRLAVDFARQVQIRSSEAVGRMHLATAFSNAGQPDSALASAQAAIALARVDRNYRAEGRALAEVGRAYAASGMLDSARGYYLQAISVMRSIGYARGVRNALADMAESLRRGGGAEDLSTAVIYFDSAAAVVDLARRSAGEDENAVAFLEDQVDVFGGWARAWMGRRAQVGSARSAASALGAVERGRAQSLADMVTRLQSVERARALAQSRPAVGRDLSTEVDSLLAPLRASKSAALTYLHAGDTLFTWFLAPSGVLHLQQPVRLTEIELSHLVRSARRSLEADDARSVQLNPDELGSASDSLPSGRNSADDWKRLAQLLLPADLASKVPAGTPIVIVPTGTIGLVPFSALLMNRDSSSGVRSAGRRSSGSRTKKGGDIALGSRNPLRYAPSFTALRASETRPRVAVSRSSRTKTGAVTSLALVVGNPTMPFVYSGRWTTRARLQPLPGAESESRTIAALLGVRALIGTAATETVVRRRMMNAPVIHFATHGLGFGTAASARRSFVAFAPDSLQDGLLTLGELMDEQTLVFRAELVVLSACQTGLGNMTRAEGSIGVQRAFLAKGARSVLVSLWNVDDKATRLLMESFYRYWLDPIHPATKARALQRAQETVRRTPGFADPKFWAAFQLVGAD